MTAAGHPPLQDWVGSSELRSDTATAAPLAGLSATLDRVGDPAPQPGDAVPPLAHWLYFLPAAPQSELGSDGHPQRGGFLPPVQLPRRMWAGGRLRFHHDLKVGDAIQRRSTVTSVDTKQGRSGALVFVTVRHAISNADGLAIDEEHDIVYRAAPGAATAAAAAAAAAPAGAPPVHTPNDDRNSVPSVAEFSRQVVADPVLLFRYSALTFNGHRIHYDRDHATAVEGYPGLVVHGPLIATLLLDLARRQWPQARVRRFDFKAASPLFVDGRPFSVCGRKGGAGSVALWASNRHGQLAMQASAEFDAA